MVIVLFRGGRGAALTLAHAEQEEFINEIISASRVLGRAKVEDHDPGPGGQIPLGSEVVQVAPEDVVLAITFEPEARLDHSVGTPPSIDQLHIAAVALDEMARFQLRKQMALQEQAALQQSQQRQEVKRGLRVIDQHTKGGPVQ